MSRDHHHRPRPNLCLRPDRRARRRCPQNNSSAIAEQGHLLVGLQGEGAEGIGHVRRFWETQARSLRHLGGGVVEHVRPLEAVDEIVPRLAAELPGLHRLLSQVQDDAAGDGLAIAGSAALVCPAHCVAHAKQIDELLRSALPVNQDEDIAGRQQADLVLQVPGLLNRAPQALYLFLLDGALLTRALVKASPRSTPGSFQRRSYASGLGVRPRSCSQAGSARPFSTTSKQRSTQACQSSLAPLKACSAFALEPSSVATGNAGA